MGELVHERSFARVGFPALRPGHVYTYLLLALLFVESGPSGVRQLVIVLPRRHLRLVRVQRLIAADFD